MKFVKGLSLNYKKCFCTKQERILKRTFENRINRNDGEKKKYEKVQTNFSKEKIKNIDIKVDLENLNSKELLYYLGYCSKNKKLNFSNIDVVMKHVEIKIIESINCLNTDISHNKKNILNKKSYENTENNKKKPFFYIPELIKIYLNVCYFNSFFFFKYKKNETIYPIRLSKKTNKNTLEKNCLTTNKSLETYPKESNHWEEAKINNFFYKDKYIYTNVIETDNSSISSINNSNSMLERKDVSNNYVANEYLQNIFNTLSVFFIQNISILNNNELSSIFYGYNKSKFSNERYLNNLILEIIKRIKKMESYNLYLIILNCYYLKYIDFMFVKILMIHIISNLCKLSREAICKILPLVHIFSNSEKIIYKINIFYAKKVLSFNKLSHLIKLFKKIVQYNLISQKNIILSIKKLNHFIHLKNGTFCLVRPNNNASKPSLKKDKFEPGTAIEENVPDMNYIVEAFDRHEMPKHNNHNEKKYKQVVSDNLHNYTPKEMLQTYLDRESLEEKNTIFNNSDFLFDLKLIEMHLRHDFTHVYSLFPQEHKKFFMKIRKISYPFNKDLQGEKEIYILKKYMKLLNYRYITFIHGPYILHIYFIFEKLYVTWKDEWKLYPSYEQNERRNFEKYKNDHLKKEGFKSIFVCHDTFTNCRSEEEKVKYIRGVLEKHNLAKEKENFNYSISLAKTIVPLEAEFIYA